MKISDKLKWVGTFLVLTGIALTNVNYYPLNIFTIIRCNFTILFN